MQTTGTTTSPHHSGLAPDAPKSTTLIDDRDKAQPDSVGRTTVTPSCISDAPTPERRTPAGSNAPAAGAPKGGGRR